METKMGTYTTNKNLYMPTVGEQGWGTLVNGNFETIDNFLKPITVSGSTYTFTGNHVGNQSGGSISATSITNSGTLTQTGTSTFTGKITGNGGIGATSLTTSSTITSSGKITGNGGIGTTSLTTSSTITSTGLITANSGVQGFLFIKGTLQTSSADATYVSKGAINIDGNTCLNPNYNNTLKWDTTYPYSLSVPICSKPNYFKANPGVYVKAADVSGTISSTRAVTFTNTSTANTMEFGYKLASASSYTEVTMNANTSITLNIAGTYHIWYRFAPNDNYNGAFKYLTISCPAQTYYIKYATP